MALTGTDEIYAASLPPHYRRAASNPGAPVARSQNGVLIEYGHADDDYLVDVLAQQASDFVDRSSEDGVPFFAFVTPFAPDQPATPAPRYAGAFAGERAKNTIIRRSEGE